MIRHGDELLLVLDLQHDDVVGLLVPLLIDLWVLNPKQLLGMHSLSDLQAGVEIVANDDEQLHEVTPVHCCPKCGCCLEEDPGTYYCPFCKTLYGLDMKPVKKEKEDE